MPVDADVGQKKRVIYVNYVYFYKIFSMHKARTQSVKKEASLSDLQSTVEIESTNIGY